MKKRDWCGVCQQAVAYCFVPLDCRIKSISYRQVRDHMTRGARPRYRQVDPQIREDLPKWQPGVLSEQRKQRKIVYSYCRTEDLGFRVAVNATSYACIRQTRSGL